jgi:hypothetical protein
LWVLACSVNGKGVGKTLTQLCEVTVREDGMVELVYCKVQMADRLLWNENYSRPDFNIVDTMHHMIIILWNQRICTKCIHMFSVLNMFQHTTCTINRESL